MVGSITSTGTGYFSDKTPIYTRAQPKQFNRRQYSENTEISQTTKTQLGIGDLEKISSDFSPEIKAVLGHLADILVELYAFISNYNCGTQSLPLMQTSGFKNANKKAWEILSRTDLNDSLENYREIYNTIMKEAKVVHENSLTKKNKGKNKKNGQKTVC